MLICSRPTAGLEKSLVRSTIDEMVRLPSRPAVYRLLFDSDNYQDWLKLPNRGDPLRGPGGRCRCAAPPEPGHCSTMAISTVSVEASTVSAKRSPDRQPDPVATSNSKRV